MCQPCQSVRTAATIRLTTNYRINDESPTIDRDVERFIYDALHEGGFITADYDTFIDRENHAAAPSSPRRR